MAHVSILARARWPLIVRGESEIDMATKAAVPGMIDAFQYAPGDGRRYSWSGVTSADIMVERIDTIDGILVMVPTGDLIPAPETRTATAFMDAVDAWRAGQ